MAGDDKFRTCLREEPHDYIGAEPTGQVRNGLFFTEHATKDPYLDVTLAAGGNPLLTAGMGNNMGSSANLMTG